MEKQEIAYLLYVIANSTNIRARREAKQLLLLLEPNEIPFLIQEEDKSYWKIAAEIIEKIGYPQNSKAIPKLIELFQDFNWPGAQEALNSLLKLEISTLIPYIEDALYKACEEKDYIWIYGIKKLIICKDIKYEDFNRKAAFKILELAEE